MASQPDAVAGAAAPAVDTIYADSREHQSPEQSVEMSDLPASSTPANEDFRDAGQQQQQQHGETSSADAALPTSPTSPSQNHTQTSPAPPHIARKQSEALGPATEAPIAHPTLTTAAGPTLSISLMLTTGARHPYKIDEKYLRSRKVESTNAGDTFDPREISGYQLKELIWTDWRNEWESRPASPSSIRLIILGRMIDDKFALKDFPFKMDQTNVVHMTVKPADLLDDEETGGKGTGKGGVQRARDTEDRGAGCRCVIL